MKKIIIALVCATVSMTAMAQPQPCEGNQECRQAKFCPGMGCGIDSTTMKTVMDLRKKYHDNYRKELRQTLGDEKYIQYLEFMIDKKKNNKMMKRSRLQRKGFGKRGQGNGQQMRHNGRPDMAPKDGVAPKDAAKDKKKDGKRKDNKKDNEK